MMKVNKQKAQQVIKRKLKFQDYKNCLNVAEIERKRKYLEKKEINDGSLKEITKYKQLMLKTKQRFKSETYNIFPEELKQLL